ncbi:MAG: universal stress protein [Thermoleophilia bacterium]|nr:universal stress protein [Thermoleophilia bacterium]
MFSRLLVSYDGSEEADAALSFAAALAGRSDAGVTVVHVLEPERRTLRRRRRRDPEPATEKEAAEWLDEVIGRTPLRGRAESVILEASRPAHEIIDLVAEVEADLLLAGRRGSHARPGFLLGGVAERLIAYSPCSVALFSAGHEAAPAPTVIAGHDGSAEADRALDAATGLAVAFSARLVILSVVDYFIPFGGVAPESVREGIRHDAERTLHEAVAGLAAPLDSVSEELGEGDPRAGLLAAAEEARPLALVLGHTGERGFSELMLGRTASAVATGARCPVVVVKPTSG